MGVEEQEYNSAAPCGKWKDVTAPLGLGLLNAKHLLISSNFAVNAFVFVCMYICHRQRWRELGTEKHPFFFVNESLPCVAVSVHAWWGTRGQ